MKLILKRWVKDGWVTQLLGKGIPIEVLLFERDILSEINNMPGLYTPILGATICCEELALLFAAW